MIKSRSFIITLGFCVLAVTNPALAQIPNQNSDAEILGLVSVIDQSEIQAAQLAMQKHTDPRVLDYAKMLNKEHSEHLTMTQKLSQQLSITPADNTSAINQVRNKNEEDLAALTRVDGDAFAQLYIADMIKGHSDALNWIENQGTKNQQVKAFLKDTQKHIAMHLAKAQEIQKHQSIGQTQ